MYIAVIDILGKNLLYQNRRFQRDPLTVILVIYQNRTTYLGSTCLWPIKLVHRNKFKSTIAKSGQVEALQSTKNVTSQKYCSYDKVRQERTLDVLMIQHKNNATSVEGSFALVG